MKDNKDNMQLWNKVKTPPKSALKEIQGGRLKGMTDIKPQWRFEIMTECFGICGIDWKYTIEKLWREEGADGEVFAFAQINLYIKCDDKWSEAIPGTGGSHLVSNEQRGKYNSDEGYKMAITDGLSVCMKALGVGADIYLGLGADSKYSNTHEKTAIPKQKQENNAKSTGTISEPQQKRLFAISKQSGMPIAELKKYMQKNYNVSDSSGILKKDYENLCSYVGDWTAEPTEDDLPPF